MNDYLYHHGIKGMKWGVRRYQNPDGTLTPEGRERYRVTDTSTRREVKQAIKAASNDRTNRDNIREHLGNSLRSSKVLNDAKQQHERTVRRANTEYANLYNKHVTSRNDFINPSTFDYRKDWYRLDSDIDEAIWDNAHGDSQNLFRMVNDIDAINARAENERKRIINSYVDLYNDALVADVPHDSTQDHIASDLIRAYSPYNTTGVVASMLGMSPAMAREADLADPDAYQFDNIFDI